VATKKTSTKSAKKAAKSTAEKESSSTQKTKASDAVEKDPQSPKSQEQPQRSSRIASILGRPTAADRRKEAEQRKEEFHSVDLSEIKPEHVKFFQKLLAIREQYSAQLHGHAKESAEEMTNYSLHMADSGTDNFDRDFNLSLMSADQDTLYEIDEALKRIKNGTYGVCELTGKPIPKARLEAIPWARFTIEAQQQLEKAGEVKTKRLGALGTLEKSSASMGMDSDDEESSNSKSSKDKD
jgi:RNA polymerase-binding protein DksA